MMGSQLNRDEVARRLGLALIDAFTLALEAARENSVTRSIEPQDADLDEKRTETRESSWDLMSHPIVEQTRRRIEELFAEHGTSLDSPEGHRLLKALGALERSTILHYPVIGKEMYVEALRRAGGPTAEEVAEGRKRRHLR